MELQKQNVEKEMEERINSEVESLKIQVQLLEIELETSRNRAENAEEELRQFKATIRLSAKMDFTATDSEIEKPKMVPPPPPPPPPPPMFDFGPQVTIRSRSNSQTEQSLSDAISNAQNTLTNTSSRKNMKASTGLEAVIADLKSGKVTLRRRQKVTIPTSPKDEYSNIYNLLEKNQNQNRMSKKMIENELSTVFKKFNLNL